MQRIPLTVALAACIVCAAADAEPLHFRFQLDNDYSTSAGAFDASGTLVRTLWSNRRLTAGSHDGSWDGRDDDGHAVRADADYEIRLLTHNVIYTWDGVIGSNSPDQTSPFHHDGPYFFADFAVSGDRAFFTAPNEGPVPTMRYIRLGDPQTWGARPALPIAYGATMSFVAADRERVYWAHDSSGWQHTWGKGGDQAFVMATDRDLSREIVFEAGHPTCVQRVGQGCYRDAEMNQNFRSAIDIVTDFREDPATRVLEGARNNVTGLAVQNDGPLLFVAHGKLSPARIHVLDKRSGRLLARIPLPGVGRLVAVAGRDELWAIHDGANGRVVSHLAIGPAPDYTLKIERTLVGVESPLALSLTPDGKQIVVAEGGSRQQVRAFDVDTGESQWELGEKGGYAVHGPAVSPSKFSFHLREPTPSGSQRVEFALLAFAPDGSLWVGDAALSRLLKFSGQRRYLDEIAFLPGIYNMTVDRTEPTRVFAEYTEYAVDYAQPLDRGWRLARFFGDSPQLTMDHRQWGSGFVDVATLSNGRTYGLARALGGPRVDVMEVPTNGDLERFPLRLQQPVFLDAKGALYGVRSNAGGRIEVWQRPLKGFDGDGAPAWGREETRARIMRRGRDPRANATPNTFERSVALLDSDASVVFDTGNSNAGEFHLGALRNGAGGWLWRASPADREFDLAQPDGVFDTSRPWYAGMQVAALGGQIVYNYHGEGWHGEGQANQFLHWSRDGLFVGQFGVPQLRGIAPGAPGMAGNSFSIQLVQVKDATYLWHNDENSHAGLHRWHLDGVEWMRELKGRGRPGGDVALEAGRRAGRELEDPRVSGGDAAPRDHSEATALAPAGLAAKVGNGRVSLTWRFSPPGARHIEVQRLQPTYVGPRFERVAILPGNASSYVDDEPLSGEPTVYRVRALSADGASDYSNHVHLTPPAKAVVLESQSFDTPPRDLRDEFHPQATDDVSVGVIADPANPGNRVMRVRVRRPAGAKEFRARVRWIASSQLFDALNKSVGRERGSRPDIYRVRADLRFLQSHLSAGSEVSLQIDPGYNLFSTPGRRQNLIALARAEAGRAQDKLETMSFDFAALPNGAGSRGLQGYRSEPPTTVAVVFPIDLRGSGDVVEFLVDNLSVSRIDPPTAGAQ